MIGLTDDQDQLARGDAMSFTKDAWERIGPLYASILDLPFNRELAAGTLDARALRLLYGPGCPLSDLVRPRARGHRGARSGRRGADPVRRQRARGGGRRTLPARGLLPELSASPRPRPRRPSRRRPAPTTPTTCWRSPTTRPTRSASRRSCPVFGSMARSAGTCSRSPHPTTPTRPGSTPMRMRRSRWASAR